MTCQFLFPFPSLFHKKGFAQFYEMDNPLCYTNKKSLVKKINKDYKLIFTVTQRVDMFRNIKFNINLG